MDIYYEKRAYSEVEITPSRGDDNNKDMTEWGPVSIHGSGTGTFYQLRAINNPALPGPATAIIVARSNTPDSPTTPGAPADLTATAAWNDQSDSDPSNDVWEVTLFWKAAPGSTVIDKYQYRQSVDGGTTYGEWTNVINSGTTAELPLTGVTVGTIYVFKLRGVDTNEDPDVNGVPATSNPVTPGTPDAPTGLEPNDPGGISVSPTGIDFDWTVGPAVAGVSVSGYQYRYRVEAVGSWGEWVDTTYGTDSDGLLPPPPRSTQAAGTRHQVRFSGPRRQQYRDGG